MKIVAASDSHGRSILKDIVRWEPEADLYLHCGDLEDDPRAYPEWLFVKGNNDWMYTTSMPLTRVIPFQGLRIFLCHGHTFPFSDRQQAIARQAQEEGCHLALYGHTHVHDDRQTGPVRVVNPGSCWMSRDGRPASYAVITADETGIQDVTFKYEDTWPVPEKRKKPLAEVVRRLKRLQRDDVLLLFAWAGGKRGISRVQREETK